MKLRIKGDSLRLRVSPSEVVRLLEAGQIEETIHFGAAADAKLTYALEHEANADGISIRYQTGKVTVVVGTRAARTWSDGAEVGMYGTARDGSACLELAVEKDFACLEKRDADNVDTFPNPSQGAHC
ncbi:MAG TPA: hypothetical protein VKB38_23780 [Terracidiphilus sp.]|nr:hypothetical protein [Terracidiphilus sp.]